MNFIPEASKITKTMNQYVLTILIKHDLEEKERAALLTEIKEKVTGDDGKIVKEDLWGNRNLAYPIKHQDKAYYAHFELEASPRKISSLDKVVKLNEDILRYLLVRK